MMCSENQHTQGKADFSHDADAQRLDYAWKWFEYHAKQRVSMFNFFLVASGLFATAYVQALCAGEESLAIGISLLGVLIVVAFVGLDCRNAALAYLGEDVLRRLERDEFFADDFKGLNERLKEVEGGILYRDAHNPPCCCKKHKFLLKAIEIIVGICFLVGCIHAILRYVDP